MSFRPTDIFELYIYDTSTSVWVEYTDGIIDVDIKRGAQEYKGPFTQSDVGQMIIRTRSMEVDPYQNPLVRYNNQIRITATNEEIVNGIPTNLTSTIFTGFIEGINVEYRPKTEDSIVTITAIDVVGQLYKHVLSEDFIALQESWTMQELLTAMDNEEEFNWLNGVLRNIADRPAYAVGAIDSNTTAWDALTIRAKTDLGFLSARRGSNHLSYISCDKDSPNNPYNLDNYNLSTNFVFGDSFKSDGTGTSYKSIQISDGFERVVNDLTVQGFQSNIRSTNDNSVAIWRKTQANVNVSTNDIEDMQTIANEVLQEMSEPIREIFSLTFDATKYPNMARVADMGNTIEIVHEVNESLTIDRKYSIIGINHAINYSNWDVTFQLRNIAYQDASIDNPIISVSPASGTTATDFDFSYTITNPALIVSQEWDLDEGFTSTSATPTANYANGGTKTITLTVLTIYGYTITSSIQLEVAGTLPTGVINHSVSGTGIYSFSFSGDTATTYYWQFGNGQSSSNATPTTYYNTASTITVSLQVTNIYGTTTVTKSINTVASTAIPVRFVKFKIKDAWHSPEEMLDLGSDLYNPESRFSAQSYHFPTMQYININSTSAGRLINPTLVRFTEYSNFVTSSKWNRNNYSRSPRIPEQDFISNLFGPTESVTTMYIMSYNFGTPKYSTNQTHVGLEFIVDLGQEYLDITSIELKHNTAGPNGFFEVEVSQDNLLYKDAGTLDIQFNQYNPVAFSGTWPVPRSATTSTDDMTSYRKIKYVKFVSSELAVNLQQFVITAMLPFAGDYQWYQKPTENPTPVYWPPKNVFTYAGPLLTDSNTGANPTLIADGSNGPVRDRYLNELIYPTVAVPRLNDGQSYGYDWEEQYTNGSTPSGQKTFIFDLGKEKRNITGFMILSNGTMTNTNFSMTIYTSEDGFSWDALGNYSIPVPVGQARLIRTPDSPSSRGNGFVRPIRTTDNATNMTSFTSYGNNGQ